MKIRSGFVSNSSSSSFLLIGVDINSITDEQRELLEKNGFDSVDNYEDPGAIGSEWYASDYEINDIAVSTVNDTVAEIKSLLGEDADVRIYFGERYG